MSQRSSLSWIDIALLVGRVLIMVQLIPNGLRKIAEFENTAIMMGGGTFVRDGVIYPQQPPLFGFVFPEFFLVCSIIFDLLGTLLIIIGFKTRPVAAFMAVYVWLAMTIYHGYFQSVQDFMMYMRGFPFVGALLLIAVVGAGAYSVDGWQRQRGLPGRQL